MIMITLYSFIYLYMVIFDLLPIKQNKYNKLYIFNLITIFISFLLVILVALEIKVPSPSDFIEGLVRFFIP